MIPASLKFTPSDYHASFNLICCLLGIGSLAMAHDFSRAGLALGIISLLCMSICNIYATVLLSLCFLKVPDHVVTFTDLGYHCFGNKGRIAVQITQFGTCLSLPVAFLILGGSTLIPGILSSVVVIQPMYGITAMALSVLPIVLIRTLKEAFVVMLLASVATLVSVITAVSDSAVHQPWGKYPAPDVAIENVASVFGSMALAYGAAVIIPTIQREHSEPRNMPKVIIASLGAMTVIYLIIAIVGYVQYGCNSPENLLLSMRSGPWKVLGYLLMQGHIMIALCIVLNPAIFYFERHFFKTKPLVSVLTTTLMEGGELVVAANSSAGLDQNLLKEKPNDDGDAASDGFQPYTRAQTLKSYGFRTFVLGTQGLIAITFQDCFLDVVALIGATTISGCCVVIPCLFYYKMFRKEMSVKHKVFCVAVIVISVILGCFTVYKSFLRMIEKASASEYKLFRTSNAQQVLHDSEYCPTSFNNLQ